MTYPEAEAYLKSGWTITRIAWARPDLYLRMVGEHPNARAQASHRDLRLTVTDLQSDDWVNVARVN